MTAGKQQAPLEARTPETLSTIETKRAPRSRCSSKQAGTTPELAGRSNSRRPLLRGECSCNAYHSTGTQCLCVARPRSRNQNASGLMISGCLVVGQAGAPPRQLCLWKWQVEVEVEGARVRVAGAAAVLLGEETRPTAIEPL
jgi:hypothetical protein